MTSKKIPVDAHGNPVYTPEQITAYEAVLRHEDARVGLPAGGAAGYATMMAGGATGKSALLNRIAMGLPPMVMAPPTAYSYPYYDVIEGAGPFETHIEARTLPELLLIGQKTQELRGKKSPAVLINQSIWNVIEVVDGNTAVVSYGGWLSLGFTWRLSRDCYPVAQSGAAIIPWHDPKLGKITTLKQLQAEQRWHVNAMVERLRLAIDPQLAQSALEQARQKDAATKAADELRVAAAQGNCPAAGALPASIFTTMLTGREERSFLAHLEQSKKATQDRLDQGKPAIPDALEIEELVKAKLDRYLIASDLTGSGEYAVDAEGGLMRWCWRLHRLTPAVVPASIYLDISKLPMAAFPPSTVTAEPSGLDTPASA